MFIFTGNLTVQSLVQNQNIISHLYKLYSRKAFSGNFRTRPNPGLQKQLQLYKNTQLPDEKKEFIDENFEDDLESDFMESGNVYDKHKRELNQQKELRHMKNIGRKYFKEKKSPNLLTWAEKEQIRYLHDMDPEEWSVERLAVSFPASEEIIKKVLKSSWKPENIDRILKHDDYVRKNWNRLAEGKLDVSSDVDAHVSRFTSRQDLITSEAGTTAVIANPQKPRGKVPEFENIIKQHPNSIGENYEIQNANCGTSSSKDEYVPYSLELFNEKPVSTKKKHVVTLKEFKGNHTSKCEVNEVQEESEPGTQVIQLESSTLVKFRTKNDNVKKFASIMNQMEKIDDSFLEKIKIPKNKWQAGATYRVQDCYYDDDGSFLYRVPGMIHE